MLSAHCEIFILGPVLLKFSRLPAINNSYDGTQADTPGRKGSQRKVVKTEEGFHLQQ